MCIVTVNTARKAPHWNTVKGRIITRFGTVSAAARLFECHPNAIREAVKGRCPKVREKMEGSGLL